VPRPRLHRGGGLADRQPGQIGNQFGLVLREQGDCAVLEVGDDRLDVATGQHTVAVGGSGDGELTKTAGGPGAGGGVTPRLAGAVPQPRGHGGSAVVAPELCGVVLTRDGKQFGIQPIEQGERLGQDHVVDGQFELVNRLGERFEDGVDLP
jgi:hypothetical protein